jgi:putative colanic acid biosynthesis UDP-glucose lipid carrier transferase
MKNPANDHAVPADSARVRGVSLGGSAAWIESLHTTVQTVTLVGSLAVCLLASGEPLAGPNLVLLTLTLLIALTVATPITTQGRPAIRTIVAECVVLLGCVMLVILMTGFAVFFAPRLLLTWAIVAPVSLVIARRLTWLVCANLLTRGIARRRVLIVGAGDLGLQIARRIEANQHLGMDLIGFCEDRALDRLPEANRSRVISRMDDAAATVKQRQIDVVYMTIAAALNPRNLKLLDELRDTTASVYFVPDMVLLDLIQPRVDMIDGIPVLATCETPFQGFSGFSKRAFDVLVSSLILLLISPILAAVALAVRLDSPGPILFRQRRYGLDGREIMVYKFRSMRVMENGATVRQASRDDDRVTRVGRVLRRTSLDELPQFVNVLQGRMSIVGPRPHAVAHNEHYRHLVKGYMIRHKVKPGITGWAQVNGCRGETAAVELMAKRVEYDLEYLRRWSLRLDVIIVLRTVLLVFRDPTAF